MTTMPSLDWLFPRFCLCCQLPLTGSDGICPHCLNDLPVFDLTKHSNLLLRPDIDTLFPNCHFQQLIACAWYQAPYNQWLSQLKFHNKIHIKIAIQQLITKQLNVLKHNEFQWPDYFIILPLHNKRLAQRGYNQVSQTWLPCLKQFNLPVLSPLTKVKATQAQSQLSKHKRKLNLKNAFSCQQDLSGLSIALVDDVMTSGATLNAATDALLEAGAKQVSAFVTCLTNLD